MQTDALRNSNNNLELIVLFLSTNGTYEDGFRITQGTLVVDIFLAHQGIIHLPETDTYLFSGWSSSFMTKYQTYAKETSDFDAFVYKIDSSTEDSACLYYTQLNQTEM